ncbi:unnamed protein product [Schistosoma bovis]|nr:unnamed protein product [Schistosoma bovis]
MGSPLGPLLADVFMAHVENQTDELIGNMPLYKRYVDDILVVCEKKEDMYGLLNKLNTLQNHISLSCEEEKNDQLPFLDILLSRREDGSVKRSIFRKPTWTGQYLSYYSYCPVQYKRGLIRCLFNRLDRICTNDAIDDDVKLLNKTLIENGYPLKFINRWKDHGSARPTIASVEKKPVYITLPFRGDSNSLLLKQRLKSVINKTYCAAKVIIKERTRCMLHSKPKVHGNDCVTSHCVYQFKCVCGHTYIGRSNRDLNIRVSEHVPKWLQKQIQSSDPIRAEDKHPSSSIAKHIIETGHKIDLNSAFVVLYKSVKGRILRFIEALAIRKFKPPLCVQKQFVLTLNLPW